MKALRDALFILAAGLFLGWVLGMGMVPDYAPREVPLTATDRGE